MNRLKSIKPFKSILLILICFQSCTSHSTSEFTTLKGKFVESFTETGTLSAIISAPITVPLFDYRFGYEFKIIDLVENGTVVKAGDTLIWLDDAPIRKFILTQQEALDKENAAATRQEVMHKNAIQDLEANIQSEEASFDLRKLSMERAKFEPKQKQKIKQLEFQQAEIRREKLFKQLRVKPVMNAYDKRIQAIKVTQKEAELAKAIEALKFMYIIAPEDGMFEVGLNHRNYPPQSLQIGDQVHLGSLVGKIPNMEKMLVNSFIGEADFNKVDEGSPVIIRLDALPDVPFHGRITEIAKSCIKMDKKMVFRVKVEIVTSDIRLKPGMTVSCEYICYQGEDELFAPNECVYRVEDKAFIFINKGKGYKRIEVEAGRSNSYHTIIQGDIKAGVGLIPFAEIIKQKSF